MGEVTHGWESRYVGGRQTFMREAASPGGPRRTVRHLPAAIVRPLLTITASADGVQELERRRRSHPAFVVLRHRGPRALDCGAESNWFGRFARVVWTDMTVNRGIVG
jgi:hypothetical protein